MTETRHGFGTTMRGVAFADAVGRVTDALKQEGFGVLTEIERSDFVASWTRSRTARKRSE